MVSELIEDVVEGQLYNVLILVIAVDGLGVPRMMQIDAAYIAS